jgi:hypothetical protein
MLAAGFGTSLWYDLPISDFAYVLVGLGHGMTAHDFRFVGNTEIELQILHRN